MLGQGPVRTGELLWQPHAERVARSNLTAFLRWLQLQRGRRFVSYEALWEWSVTDLEGFWAAIWDYFLVRPSVPYSRVLARRQMPGAQWFPGARSITPNMLCAMSGRASMRCYINLKTAPFKG